MNLLVIGSGGREHALVWKLAQSPRVKKIFCIPGNGGIAGLAKCIKIDILDFPQLITFAKDNKIALTVVGPEAPLAAGIVDAFLEAGQPIFGPSAAVAILEASKVFAKEFMVKNGIPTAGYRVFSSATEAKRYIGSVGVPCVIKADGLAAGKGVIIATTKAEAIKSIEEIMESKMFGAAGKRVIIEEFLDGEEVSVIAITDGRTIIPMLPAQDHKRIFDRDKGPNTGGMGSYAPAPICDKAMLARVKKEILEPTVQGMSAAGRPFVGVLYAGLMLTAKGPKVLEYNVRFGDPETQAILSLMKTDLLDICQAAIAGQLKGFEILWHQGFAVCVVASVKGYPGEYPKGIPITINQVPKHTTVFHAGTALNASGQLVTAGGRVLSVTSNGSSITEAIDNAYTAIEAISFDSMYYRKDIAAKALANAKD